MKRAVVLRLLIILPTLLGLRTAVAEPRAEILWDTWGVPHIFARDSESLFYAFGRAQMQSHGDLILKLYGQARGRAAEYWGKKHLDSDRYVRTVGIPDRARRWYEEQSPTFRKCLDAFAAGINDYAREHFDQIAPDMRIVLPVTAVDVIAHSHRVIHFIFVSSRRSAPLVQWQQSAGSNGWAIAPGRSASGNALLLANPHLPWFDLFLFYEAQLSSPGINAYGATLVGFPVFGVAFNDSLGWTHTVNTYDGEDHYELATVDGGYRWEGKTKAFEQEVATLKVKQEDGSVNDERLVIKRSVHGPVVAEKPGKAIALRVAGLDRPGMLEEWWEMARARNLMEFEASLKRMQIPGFNVVYADRDGHIFYLFNGLVPVRPKGDWNYWMGIIPGDSAATLWNETHPYTDLPKLVDPATGWLQNANDPPWTVTLPVAIDARKFPPYMAPRSMEMRPQRSARMLMEDEHISFDEMVSYKHSTRMELADRLLDDLIPAARTYGGEMAREAAAVLEKWDRNCDANSRGAMLFVRWAQQMKLFSIQSKAFSIPWDEKKPFGTPDGLADPKAAVAELETAATKVKQEFGALDVAWGDVARLRSGKLDFAGNGGSSWLGIFRNIEYEPKTKGRYEATGGDSYVMAVEFSNPIKARVLLSYGNATQRGSAHLGDQLELVARKEMRPVWRKRSEVETHLESRDVIK
jgi:acyl-homoserine-lactone acylase